MSSLSIAPSVIAVDASVPARHAATPSVKRGRGNV